MSLADFIAWLDETQDPEHVVVAGGSVVVGDVSLQVHAHGSAGDNVDAAAHALPVTAPDASSAAGGLVVDDPAAQDREAAQRAVQGGRAVVDAAALAVAAV